jgi:hypothetical protein
MNVLKPVDNVIEQVLKMYQVSCAFTKFQFSNALNLIKHLKQNGNQQNQHVSRPHLPPAPRPFTPSLQQRNIINSPASVKSYQSSRYSNQNYEHSIQGAVRAKASPRVQTPREPPRRVLQTVNSNVSYTPSQSSLGAQNYSKPGPSYTAKDRHVQKTPRGYNVQENQRNYQETLQSHQTRAPQSYQAPVQTHRSYQPPVQTPRSYQPSVQTYRAQTPKPYQGQSQAQTPQTFRSQQSRHVQSPVQAIRKKFSQYNENPFSPRAPQSSTSIDSMDPKTMPKHRVSNSQMKGNHGLPTPIMIETSKNIERTPNHKPMNRFSNSSNSWLNKR